MSSYGKVWSTFISKNNTGAIVKLRVQELSHGRLEEVIDLFVNYFATEEAMFKAAGVPKNKEALKEYKEELTCILNQRKHQIDVCYVEHDNTSQLVGASIMILSKKEDDLDEKSVFQQQTNEMKKLCQVVYSLFSKYDVFNKHNLDTFYDDRGIVVKPGYRGLGVATEFFRARRMVCKEHGVPLTAAWMTSRGSQKAAVRDGWETVHECNYEEFGRNLGVTFEGVPESCKLMIARV